MLFPSTKRSTAALTVVALATVATAADSNSIATGLTTACQNAVVSLLSSAFVHVAWRQDAPGATVVRRVMQPNFSPTTSGSVIAPVNSWLENVCTRTCNSSTVDSAQTTISTGCATDITNRVATAVALQSAIVSYSIFRSAACLESTSNSTLCLTQLLTDIQEVSGNLTIAEVLSLTSNLTSLGSIPTAEACSDCNKALFTTLEPVLINASSTEASQLRASLSSKCGATFVDSMMPSSVSTSTGNATTGSSPTANGSTSTTSTPLSAGKGLRLTVKEVLVAVVALGLGTVALA
ncbi:BQ2448_4646 [Microbotryum intermedium]|uniref:BQ2448_4646 protein n=1 Tax=Microbotryum intermedium TaxID=269621 RepID=A0A238FDQ2_9BASI|nr:BQ2448_4646 [Microbotryum intermedium]